MWGEFILLLGLGSLGRGRGSSSLRLLLFLSLSLLPSLLKFTVEVEKRKFRSRQTR
jgi:hypothetical protein